MKKIQITKSKLSALSVYLIVSLLAPSSYATLCPRMKLINFEASASDSKIRYIFMGVDESPTNGKYLTRSIDIDRDNLNLAPLLERAFYMNFSVEFTVDDESNYKCSDRTFYVRYIKISP